MNDIEDLNSRGHNLTKIGVRTFYCENCGAFVQTSKSGVESIFHTPPHSPSCCTKCVGFDPIPGNGKPRTLKAKLEDEAYFSKGQ